MGEDLLLPQMDGGLVLRRTGDGLLQFQIVKHALVQRPLPPPTLPELLVVVVQALPVLAELVEAGLVDILEDAARTPRDLPSFSQTVHLALAIALVLAVHVVVIVRLAAGADEVAGAQQRGGGSTDLGDLGDVVGEGGGVDENLLVESRLSCTHRVGLWHAMGGSWGGGG